jgi:hypothetical protein
MFIVSEICNCWYWCTNIIIKDKLRILFFKPYILNFLWLIKKLPWTVKLILVNAIVDKNYRLWLSKWFWVAQSKFLIIVKSVLAQTFNVVLLLIFARLSRHNQSSMPKSPFPTWAQNNFRRSAGPRLTPAYLVFTHIWETMLWTFMFPLGSNDKSPILLISTGWIRKHCSPA